MEDYEQTYEEFWRDLVETDGQLDLDKVKRELHDYRFLLLAVPKVYDHVTGGRISKPNTLPEVIIAEVDDCVTREINAAIQEELAARNV